MKPRPWAQRQLFDASAPVPRPPGWNLIANTSGTQGFHVVDHTTPDSGVVTVCGIAGRVIENRTSIISPCPICASTEVS